MSDWQERITRETAPAIRAEHDLRYRTAAPLILAGSAWVDLGCGNGVASRAALGDSKPPHTVLVDIDGDSVARAAEELAVPDARQLPGDLTNPGFLAEIESELPGGGERATLTCFEVVEHLSTFVPLLEWAAELSSSRGATFVISVPNDAFWAIENPHHLTEWSEGAFEELRRLLPAEQTLLRQVSLTGSALVSWDAEPAEHELTVSVGGDGTVASHFIAAFGPRHTEIALGAVAAQEDKLSQRLWERQRESNMALVEQASSEQRAALKEQRELIAEHEATIMKEREKLRENTKTFDEWRAYIHELEGELGRPPSGGEQTT